MPCLPSRIETSVYILPVYCGLRRYLLSDTQLSRLRAYGGVIARHNGATQILAEHCLDPGAVKVAEQVVSILKPGFDRPW